MKPRKPTELGRCLLRFFQDYLPTLRGVSVHTIRSYRDAVVLLLRFTARESRCPIEALDLSDLNADHVKRFLKSLESERGNSIATRNARLAAIHAFARFVIAEHPEHLAPFQQVLGIPFKRGAREAPIEYLETAEIETLLTTIDQSRPAGQRDFALFALMFNTGARVQEILNLRICDLRLDPPPQVRLRGKGNKVRVCPIWPHTAQLLRELIRTRPLVAQGSAELPVFVNCRGTQMSRFGVRYLLRKYMLIASTRNPTLAHKEIHPHSLRHTTAIQLLKAGVDFATISQWLGHASLNTTMRYARADIDLKRQALAQVFPEILAPPRGGAFILNGADLVGWLRRL